MKVGLSPAICVSGEQRLIILTTNQGGTNKKLPVLGNKILQFKHITKKKSQGLLIKYQQLQME